MKAVLLSILAWAALGSCAEICWEPCGCFFDDPPFGDRPLPEDYEVQQISWLLYTQSNPTVAREIVIIDRESIEVPSEFDPSKPTKVLIHGWTGSRNSLEIIRQAYIDGFDYNILVVDWEEGASRVYYPQAASNTQVVGACSAWVAEQLSQDRSNFHCVGHSLGGQTCGYMGKRSDDLGRITGLDPAGPFFDGKDATVHLNSTDCDFMDILHTNSDGTADDQGMRKAVGHVDFYPNNGGRQPGCEDSSCDHGICVDYFAESITNPTAYPSYPCEDQQDVATCNSCTDGVDCQYMGDPADTYPGRGTFYLDMNT